MAKRWLNDCLSEFIIDFGNIFKSCWDISIEEIFGILHSSKRKPILKTNIGYLL